MKQVKTPNELPSYNSPEVEVMDIRVESGFANSPTGTNEDFTTGTGNWD